jgi:type II secretory pathway component PulF
MSSQLSAKAMNVVYIILGIVVTILVLIALLPTIDQAFTDLSGNVTGSTNFVDFAALIDILPLLFIVGIFILLIGLVIKAKGKE